MFELLSKIHDKNNLPNRSLEEIACNAARVVLAEALQLEAAKYINSCQNFRDENGHRLVVRNGKAKKRKITIGAGAVEVEAPRIDDRRKGLRFQSQLLPRYMRKSPTLEAALSLLHLKGVSTNGFRDALRPLLGENVGGLSKSSIAALKKKWVGEFEKWKKQKIEDRFVYLWADGVHINVRLGEDKKLCLLVVIGVTDKGEKKLLAVESGYRESAESWRMLLRELVERGLNTPSLLIGDGALGLWAAMRDIPAFAQTKWQRCWVHKIANVLDKLPKRLQPQAKGLLHEMMNAPDEESAVKARDFFVREFGDKYPKAVDCLLKDWDKMTTFFSFPALHWRHIRTTNPIESTFATVKLRTKSTKGAGSKQMAEVMAFKLMMEAQKKWNKIRGFRELEFILSGRRYKDGKPIAIPETSSLAA